MLCLYIQENAGGISIEEIHYLLGHNIPEDILHIPSKLNFLGKTVWKACRALEKIEAFLGLSTKLEKYLNEF